MVKNADKRIDDEDPSENFETKKLALIRIWQILHENTDEKHTMTQQEIIDQLDSKYGIFLKRKAVKNNISCLNEINPRDEMIEVLEKGCYLKKRPFQDSELRMLIDGVMASKYISAQESKDLIKRICSLSNKYFKSSDKHIKPIADTNLTANDELFENIDSVDEAIEKGKKIHYDYNKFGTDKKLHKSSEHTISPYLMILHNQRYYLMGFSDKYENIAFHRLDHISNVEILGGEKSVPIRSVKGFENGINYKELTSARPYMYTDKPERIKMIADEFVVDQIVDWFGDSVSFYKCKQEKKVEATVIVSPKAMEHWAMQYINHVEITFPQTLRDKIKENLEKGLEKYK